MKNITILATVALMAAASFGGDRNDASAKPCVLANDSVRYIQRTMRRLSESTKEKPATVRVAFYGQSIVCQGWTPLVIQALKRRYPTANILHEKRAIGGYVSPNLIRTAEPDLYPSYPDLLFFHVYGPLEKYEQIVAEVRRRTTAEIILWSSHLNRRDSADPAARLAARDKRTVGIRAIAERHHCMYVDLNRKWCEMMLATGKTADDLLADGIHLKGTSLPFYANMLAGELIRLPKAPDLVVSGGTVTDVAPTLAGGKITFSFTGNRLMARSNGRGKKGATATVTLDGKPMANRPELWAATRPTSAPRWMPCVNCVSFKTAPVAEEWSLVFPEGVPSNYSAKARFTLAGSVTGPDGAGDTKTDFVSASGRICILACDQAAANWQCGMFKKGIAPGFAAKWKTYPLFTETYVPQPAGTETRLVQNCANGPHVIEITPAPGYTCEDLGIASATAYAPPVK